MKQVRVWVAALVMTVTAVSCQKIEKYNAVDLLVDKEWRLVSVTENGTEVAETCQLDDVMLLNSAGEVTHNLGALNCEDESEFEEWKFRNEFSEIRFKGTTRGSGFAFGTYFKEREIIQLTEEKLVLKETYPSEAQALPQVFTYLAP